MKRISACTFIVAYISALALGNVSHTLQYQTGCHPLMYMVIWDMFCGWSAYANQIHVIAEGESEKYYELAPGPWGIYRPWGGEFARHHGYRLDELVIVDPDVVGISGKAVHSIARHSGDPLDRIDGIVFELGEEELAETDDYEVEPYRRIEAVLKILGPGQKLAVDANGRFDQATAIEYAKALGARLRAIRTQQGLSLHGVEEKSQGRWKAVVVGSYERGDRAVTVQRLAELADFYGVPVGELLPEGSPAGSAEPAARLVIDLEQLQRDVTSVLDANRTPTSR